MYRIFSNGFKMAVVLILSLPFSRCRIHLYYICKTDIERTINENIHCLFTEYSFSNFVAWFTLSCMIFAHLYKEILTFSSGNLHALAAFIASFLSHVWYSHALPCVIDYFIVKTLLFSLMKMPVCPYSYSPSIYVGKINAYMFVQIYKRKQQKFIYLLPSLFSVFFRGRYTNRHRMRGHNSACECSPVSTIVQYIHPSL